MTGLWPRSQTRTRTRAIPIIFALITQSKTDRSTSLCAATNANVRTALLAMKRATQVASRSALMPFSSFGFSALIPSSIV